MANKVTHFEVLGKDAKRLQDFFSQLFDWKVDADNPMNYGIIQGEDGGIGGGIAAGQDGQSHVTFYVEVDDPQAYLTKAEGMGGKTLMPPMDVPGGPQIALFADPEGHVIGLAKRDSM